MQTDGWGDVVERRGIGIHREFSREKTRERAERRKAMVLRDAAFCDQDDSGQVKVVNRERAS